MNNNIGRREFAKYSGLCLLGASASGWLPRLAAEIQQVGTKPPRSCILLWMSGGPSQMETFDPKEGNENGGPTKAIDTSVPGIRIAQHKESPCIVRAPPQAQAPCDPPHRSCKASMRHMPPF